MAERVRVQRIETTKAEDCWIIRSGDLPLSTWSLAKRLDRWVQRIEDTGCGDRQRTG